MKRLFLLSALALLLLGAPCIIPESHLNTAVAAVRVVEKKVTAVCFVGNTLTDSKQVRVHFNQDGVPDKVLTYSCNVYSCDESAPDGRSYQYCFYVGNQTWYFNL